MGNWEKSFYQKFSIHAHCVENWEKLLAEAAGHIAPTTATNVREWRSAANLPGWAAAAIDLLLGKRLWHELDRRFFRSIALGTAGMRGRVIAESPVGEEVDGDGRPVHAAVGSACMNDFCVVRATVAIYRHWAAWLAGHGCHGEVPKIIIANDVRHFSRHFAEIAAATWQAMGGNAFLFPGPRSTPQLSFTVRHLRATAGVVITASHNPSHDNGYKVYAPSGEQVVGPNATAIMEQFAATSIEETCAMLENIAAEKRCHRLLPLELDKIYLQRLGDSVIDAAALRHLRRPIVFTPLHGTGSVIGRPLLARFHIPFVAVEPQCPFDPEFSTVSSPNPENRRAFAMALTLADAGPSDLAFAMDPDADRLAVAIRSMDGAMRILTGNEIAVLLLSYRLEALREAGLLTAATAPHMAIIRSLVTTPLLDRIGAEYGVRTVTLPTGFKWIGQRLDGYESELTAAILQKNGLPIDYRSLDEERRRKLTLAHGTFLVLGAEESYGYMALDCTRDKDAHSALLMVCEAIGSLQGNGIHPENYLDKIYRRHGYHCERLHTATLASGAEGERQAANFLKTLRTDPPKFLAALPVVRWTNLENEKMDDGDGQPVPSQSLHLVDLADGYRVAIRPSGTEATVKFYLFAREEGTDLTIARRRTAETFDRLVAAIDELLAGDAGH
ncbi:MAG: phospho-sugar mutase [Puniceicoccales bacterium]|nr:phospho-sugar mutase [Puniceicoccales bacterium]